MVLSKLRRRLLLLLLLVVLTLLLLLLLLSLTDGAVHRLLNTLRDVAHVRLGNRIICGGALRVDEAMGGSTIVAYEDRSIVVDV